MATREEYKKLFDAIYAAMDTAFDIGDNDTFAKLRVILIQVNKKRDAAGVQ